MRFYTGTWQPAGGLYVDREDASCTLGRVTVVVETPKFQRDLVRKYADRTLFTSSMHYE
jgi:hypothetical protein